MRYGLLCYFVMHVLLLLVEYFLSRSMFKLSEGLTLQANCFGRTVPDHSRSGLRLGSGSIKDPGKISISVKLAGLVS